MWIEVKPTEKKKIKVEFFALVIVVFRKEASFASSYSHCIPYVSDYPCTYIIGYYNKSAFDPFILFHEGFLFLKLL